MREVPVVLVIDNYDSFTYNLVQAIGAMGYEMAVYRNDKLTVEDALAMEPTHLVVSPGPCTPKEAGVSNEMIRAFAGRVPVLGVCLGHQCIAEVFGGRVVRAGRLMHGKTSEIEHDGGFVYRDVSNPFTAARYHSLIVEEESLPACLKVTARTIDAGELMGVRHEKFTVEGVQFHPESFLTPEGERLLGNFLELKGGTWDDVR